MEERTERKRAKDMAKYEFYLAGALEKVFWNRMPQVMEEGERISILRGEIPALQLVYRMLPEAQDEERDIFRCEVKGFPARARLRDVEQIPSAMPVRGRTDDNYLTREPGLFPDLLKPRRDDLIVPVEGQYRAVWIDFPGTKEVEGGIYPVEVALTSEKEEVRLGFTLEVSAQELPPQKLIHTQWFHADCLADYYRAEVFGEFHWQAVEKQIKLVCAPAGGRPCSAPCVGRPRQHVRHVAVYIRLSYNEIFIFVAEVVLYEIAEFVGCERKFGT